MEKESKGSKGKGGGKTSAAGDAATKFALKLLAPEALAGAIVGREGAKIAAMRAQFGAGVQLSDRSETYPGTDCRQLTLQCDTEEKLLDLAKHILGIHAELIKPEELQKNKNPTAAAESLGKDGDLKVGLLVPRAAAGGIIGKGGASIKKLRESSGVKKLVIGDAPHQEPSANQTVNLVGNAGAVETVVRAVSAEVQSLKAEPWFPAWVSAGVPSAGWGGSSGWDDGWGGSSWDDGWGHSGGWHEGWGDDWGGGWGGGPGWGGMNTLAQVARETPANVLEDSRGFAMTCTVPRRLTGGLIGKRGYNIQNVKSRTNTEISIRPLPDDPDHSSLNIVGPLPNACAAYMLMMKLYLDAEEAGG